MTKINIVSNDGPGLDGTYALTTGAKGGTEMMMEGLKSRIEPDLLDRFNIICSRVRHVDPDKKNILWLHDTWNDPESAHLTDPESRAKFDKLVFVSHYQQNSYNMGLGVPYHDGVVIQNAIVPITPHQKPNDGTVRLIYHTTPHRGLELLVPAFEVLQDRYKNIHLDVFSSFEIYGWKQRDEQYQAIFDRCRANPKINYHGYQPNDVVREALTRADIYAYPSIWTETSCISVIEAMSAGCIVVCPTLGALPETCSNHAVMYPYNEDNHAHANGFAGVLAGVIEQFNDGLCPSQYQKPYFDSVHGWDGVAERWRSLLRSL